MLDFELESRIKSLERTVSIMRISVIVVVVFMVANAFSHEFGSRVIFADKIKARAFVLLGSGDNPTAYWDNQDTIGLKIYAEDGSHVALTPDAVTFYKDRQNPVVVSKYD